MLPSSTRTVALVGLLACGCATLDTTRPIEKGTLLFRTNYE
jgi:hypothetical protein